MIRTGTGNLLSAEVDALVNTVNCAGVMGKGIALQFKKAWPAMFRAYQVAARAGELRPGQVLVWQTGQLGPPRFIFNFPTKRHWKQPSRLEDIDAGLVDLVAKIRELGVRSVAIPPLGAGNGGLDWVDVRPRIVDALRDLTEVDVWLWEPGDAPPPAQQPVNTERPRWTPARAAVIALMGQYRILDDDLTQLEIQKLAYFLQESGHDLRLNYARQVYGPYADELYHLLHRLEGHFLHGLVDRRPEAVLQVEHEAVEEASRFLDQEHDVQPRFQRVARLIEGFETPYGMELLATVHWVAKEEPAARTDPEVALRAVQAWSARKRSQMRPSHVRTAWQRLRDQGWLESLEATPTSIGPATVEVHGS
ncbi:MAG: macro domain-containing protein [Myxococcota bacterium]